MGANTKMKFALALAVALAAAGCVKGEEEFLPEFCADGCSLPLIEHDDFLDHPWLVFISDAMTNLAGDTIYLLNSPEDDRGWGFFELEISTAGTPRATAFVNTGVRPRGLRAADGRVLVYGEDGDGTSELEVWHKLGDSSSDYELRDILTVDWPISKEGEVHIVAALDASAGAVAVNVLVVDGIEAFVASCTTDGCDGIEPVSFEVGDAPSSLFLDFQPRYVAIAGETPIVVGSDGGVYRVTSKSALAGSKTYVLTRIEQTSGTVERAHSMLSSISGQTVAIYTGQTLSLLTNLAAETATVTRLNPDLVGRPIIDAIPSPYANSTLYLAEEGQLYRTVIAGDAVTSNDAIGQQLEGAKYLVRNESNVFLFTEEGASVTLGIPAP